MTTDMTQRHANDYAIPKIVTVFYVYFANHIKC